jgi:hypothetical protein
LICFFPAKLKIGKKSEVKIAYLHLTQNDNCYYNYNKEKKTQKKNFTVNKIRNRFADELNCLFLSHSDSQKKEE